ncbi:MAG: hypothetical protein Q9186_003088 [Xanthomendoza sp. 1 TL-2023]
MCYTGSSNPWLLFLLVLILRFSSSTESNPFNNPHSIGSNQDASAHGIPASRGVIQDRDLSIRNATANITNIRINNLHTFGTHAPPLALFALKAFAKNISFWEAAMEAPVAAFNFYYGALKMEMSLIESKTGVGKLTREVVRAVTRFVQKFVFSKLSPAVVASLEMALTVVLFEAGTAVLVWVVFGVPMGMWLGRAGHNVNNVH